MAYEHAKRASAAFDFDDLLLHAAVALESDLALRAALGRRWRYLLLDEVQDTNAAQYRIVALLGERHRNVMILGDPDQAICAYRVPPAPRTSPPSRATSPSTTSSPWSATTARRPRS